MSFMTNCLTKMPIKRFFLPFLSLLLLFSCVENDRTMGDDLVSDDFILKVHTATFDIPVTNKVSDSVKSVNSSSLLVGYITDPVYGTVISNAASYIIPYSQETDFGKNPKFNSGYISLSIDSTYFLDDNQEGIHQRLNIYKLTSVMDTCDGFNTSIVEGRYDPVPITTSQPVIYESGSIKINITEEFGKELLTATKEDFEDFDLFIEKFPGFYITVDPPTGNQEGGRMNYLNLGSSTLYVNYTLNNEDKGIADLDTTEAFAFGYYSAFNNFRTSSKHLENSNEDADILYTESLSGIKPHISAISLKEIFDEWMEAEGIKDEVIILSRAELIFPYESPTDYDLFNKEHPEYIYAFTNTPWATDSTRFMVPVNDANYNSNIGAIDRAHMNYSMDITSHIQDIIMEDTENIDASYDLWIAPMYIYESQTGTDYYYFNNRDYRRIILNGPAADRHPQLKLTYSILNY